MARARHPGPANVAGPFRAARYGRLAAIGTIPCQLALATAPTPYAASELAERLGDLDALAEFGYRCRQARQARQVMKVASAAANGAS